MSRVDRRAFLKGVGVVSAAGVASALLPDLAFPASTFLPKADPAGPVWHRTPCRLCGVGCGLLVSVANGRAVAVKGDPDSPVSKGLACVKGYNSVQALYGADRLTRARVRRDGVLVEVPLRDALDLVANRLRDTVKLHGKNSVAVYGSAQWTIPDAYVASKLFKGGLGTNNVETSTRLYGASAMAGLSGSFGLDGAIGCYEDIDHADTFVLWDINLAESDPVLFSRMLDRKRGNPAVRIIDLATRTTRTSYASDHTLLHVPHAGVAIANAICHEIVARKWVHRAFVDQHVAFKRGRTELGYGLGEDAQVSDVATDATWNEYVAFLADFEPERAQELSGLSAASIRWLASLYGDPQRKVMSVWGREVNQDVRGTWMNNVLYNIHLLVGKVATPGNSPFCAIGQPGGGSAVHDAGSATHTLPRGFVQNEEDRRRAAEIWGVPTEAIDPRPTGPALSMFRRLETGDIRFLWILATDPMVSLPNLDRYRRAAAKEDRFLVVSEAYPTPTTDVADVVLPAAMWLEREGIYANAERRLQHFDRIVAPPGDATGDAWQMIEVARRLGHEKLFPFESGRHVEQIWEEYTRFHAEPASALPSLAVLRAQPGVQWPYVAGRETRWRYNAAYDPAATGTHGAFDFYGHPDHRAWIWLRPYEPPAEAPDREYPFWLGTGVVLEHWGAGSMTQRIPALHRALPHAYVELNREDARDLDIRNRDSVRLVSRRGSIDLEARIDYRSQLPARPGLRPGIRRGPAGESAHARRLLSTLGSARWRQVRGAPGAAVGSERRMTGDRRPAAVALVLFLVGAAVTAVAAGTVAVQRVVARRGRAVTLPSVTLVAAPGEPIRSEAQVFRTRPAMLAIAPASHRERSAHPRTLKSVRFLRAFPGAPPRIPHPLTAEEFRTDACRTCHERGGYSVRFSAYVPLTPHPERGICLQCHVGVDSVMGTADPGADPNTRCPLCHGPNGGAPRADATLTWPTTVWPTLPLLRRDQLPPPIPHDLQFRENCLTCHAGPAAVAEIRTTHPERANCRQCHVVLTAEAGAFTRLASANAAGGPP